VPTAGVYWHGRIAQKAFSGYTGRLCPRANGSPQKKTRKSESFCWLEDGVCTGGKATRAFTDLLRLDEKIESETKASKHRAESATWLRKAKEYYREF
jgi:hypothetical protein